MMSVARRSPIDAAAYQLQLRVKEYVSLRPLVSVDVLTGRPVDNGPTPGMVTVRQAAEGDARALAEIAKKTVAKKYGNGLLQLTWSGNVATIMFPQHPTFEPLIVEVS